LGPIHAINLFKIIQALENNVIFDAKVYNFLSKSNDLNIEKNLTKS